SRTSSGPTGATTGSWPATSFVSRAVGEANACGSARRAERIWKRSRHVHHASSAERDLSEETSMGAIDLKGITPATVLPLTGDGEIDEPGLRAYIRWIAGQGIAGVAVNVDTGEGPHLWHDEKLRVLRIYKEELAGRSIPIVAGLGASFTAQAVKYGAEYRA